MTWRLYDSSKINRNSECVKCTRTIPPNEPRHVSKSDETNRWIAMCTRCYASLADHTTARQERVESSLSSHTTNGVTATHTPSPYTVTRTTYDERNERIARAHEENMESARQTRDVIVLQTGAIVNLTKVLDRVAMALEVKK